MPDETVLIVDNNPETLSSLGRMLNTWGWKTVLARHGMDAWEALLGENAPGIVLADWNLPRMGGYQLFELIRKKEADGSIHLVLMTADDRPEKIAQGLLAGADEILLKPLVPDELKARLHAAERRTAVYRRTNQHRNLPPQVVCRDVLTGLWNRKSFLGVIDHQLYLSCHRKTHTGFILIWIDDLDIFQSMYGEDITQRLFLRLAREIQLSLRSYDYLGRTARDQFLVMLPECNLEQALIKAEGMQNCVEKASRGLAEDFFTLTASVGVTAASQKTELDAAGLVHQLERKLIQSGSYGRRCIAASEPVLASCLPLPGQSTQGV